MRFQIRPFHAQGRIAPRTTTRMSAPTCRTLLGTACVAVAATGLLAAPAAAHDKCDSLANAATAAGVFYPPAAGFQVGYYVAKFVDELGEEEAVDPDVFDCGDPVSLSPEDYASITGGSDPGGLFYPYWKATGAFIQSSYDFNFAKARWQELRHEVVAAKAGGDAAQAASLQAKADTAHTLMTSRFQEYEFAHDAYASAIAEAARIYRERELSFVPPLSVGAVVKTMQASLAGDVPEFEIRFWVDHACIPPAFLDGEDLLAPADRFVNDDVPPGTFLDAEMLESPAAIFESIAMTLATDVKAGLGRLLPDNDVLPAPCAGDLSGDGVINAQDLGLLLGLWGSHCP